MRMMRGLGSVRFSLKGHEQGLRWLWVFYCDPQGFREALGRLNVKDQVIVVFLLAIHVAPYLLVFVVLCRFLVLYALDLPLGVLGTKYSVLFFHYYSALLVLGLCCVAGVVSWVTEGFSYGLASALGVLFVGTVIEGSVGWLGEGLVPSVVESAVCGFSISFAFGLVPTVMQGFAFGAVFAFFVGSDEGALASIFSGLIFFVIVTRLYYLPLHIALLAFGGYGAKRYEFHPVRWDRCCSFAFLGLHRLLVDYAEEEPVKGWQEVDRLLDGYSSQRSEALMARVMLVIRKAGAGSCIDQGLAGLQSLPEGENGYLSQTPRVKEWVLEIRSRLRQAEVETRPFLREPWQSALIERLERFRNEVIGLREPLATELRKAATHFIYVARAEYAETQLLLSREQIPQVFRAGDPVDTRQEAFLPRYGVIGDLEQQATLSTGCPGILLYGRRRVGKTTVLKNVDGFLPAEIKVAEISMQNPKAFSSLSSLLSLLLQTLSEHFPEIDYTWTQELDLESFSQAIEEVNTFLEREKFRILLAIDEFENLDVKIGEGVFSEDLLATLRDSMQNHRCITWVLAGSHHFSELTNAPWSSYLVSARQLEIPMFTEEETRLLLTEPLRYSQLWKKGDNRRPSFIPDFWGLCGIERVHRTTGGWPHLVQLVAETLVDRVNQTGVPEVTDEIFQWAIDKAIVRGDAVFYELLHRESHLEGEWEYLEGFKDADTQPPPADRDIVRSLKRRLLVSVDGEEWRLRVPLMQHWLRERG